MFISPLNPLLSVYFPRVVVQRHSKFGLKSDPGLSVWAGICWHFTDYHDILAPCFLSVIALSYFTFWSCQNRDCTVIFYLGPASSLLPVSKVSISFVGTSGSDNITRIEPLSFHIPDMFFSNLYSSIGKFFPHYLPWCYFGREILFHNWFFFPKLYWGNIDK